ncbi:MAG: hypothetical protein LUE24_13800 [Lachnospiraceae bacterium]|nr:hypothetical protein [Lachnospiraceae bacterium]
MKGNEIRLGDLLALMYPGTRVVIEDGDGLQRYRGRAIQVRESGIDLDRIVTGLERQEVTTIRKNRERHLRMVEGEVVPVDNLTEFLFRDVDLIIYEKIAIK